MSHLENKAAWARHLTEDSPCMLTKVIYTFTSMVSQYKLFTTYSFLPDARRFRFLFSFINTITYRSVTFESVYVSWKSFPCLGRKAPSVAGLPVIMRDRVIEQMVPNCLFLP